MKIEAKKYKYNLKKNAGGRPVKEKETARAPEKAAARKPRISLPNITIPKIRVPRIGLPNVRMPDLTISRFKEPRPRGKRTLFIIAFLAGAPVLLLAVWLGMNLIQRPLQKPLFTEKDLPKSPPVESNGFAIIYDDRVAAEYTRTDLSGSTMFRNGASMELYLDKTKEEYAMAKTLAGREDVKKMFGLYREIMKKPVFADMTMPGEKEMQKARAYVALHNSVIATAIARMQEGKPAAAFVMMRDLLNLSIQFVRTARSMQNYQIAMQAYEKALEIVKSMLAQSGGFAGNEALATCREIGMMLRSFNPHLVSLAPIVSYEYIMTWKRAFNPSGQRPEAPVIGRIKYKKLAFFDPGATQSLYNERWNELYQYAKHPNKKAFNRLMETREKQYASGRFWWFHNAAGKKYLDTTPVTVYQLFLEAKNRGESISRKQGEIVAVIDALKEAQPEKAAAKKKGVKKAVPPVKKKKARQK